MLKFENLHFSEEKIEKKFAVLSFDKTNKIIGYQVNLINNQLSNLLGITLKKSKEGFDISYDVTDKVTIEKYLKVRAVQTGKFSEILLSILDGIKNTEKYSFNSKNFIIRPEYIYFDNNIGEIYLLYIPVENSLEDNLEEQFKNLIKKLIVDIITIENTENNNFITDILNLLRDEAYNLLKLKRMLENYSDGSSKQIVIEENEEIEETNSIITPISNSSELLSPKTEMIMSTIERYENLENRYNSEMLDKQEKENSTLKIKYIVCVSTIQIVTIVCTILEMILLNLIDDYIKYGAIATIWIIDIIVTVIITLSRLRKNNTYRLNRRGRETSSLPFINKNTENIDCNFKNKEKKNIKMSNSNSLKDKQFPYLIINKVGIIEKVYINKDVFTIGRSTELVDYVSDNRAIGKVHAEIRKINSDYYIIDLDSKNGTFLNDKILESQEMYKIKENDVIKLANSCYTFKSN